MDRFKLIVKYSIAGLILYFLYDYVRKTTDNIDFAAIGQSAIPSYLFVSFILSVLYVFNYTFIWYNLTKTFSCQISFAQTFKARVYSEFGKYVPGKALSLTSILYFYHKADASKARVSICLAVEALLTMMSSVLVFLASIPFSRVQVAWEVRTLAAVLAAFFLILLHPPIFNKILRLFFIVIKTEPATMDFTYTTLSKLLVLYSLNWTVAGASFFFLVKSLQSFGWDFFPTFNGINALSGFIGFISILTPAGIGVREASIILLLANILSRGVSSIASIVSRLWLVSAELLLFVFAGIYSLMKKKSSQPCNDAESR